MRLILFFLFALSKLFAEFGITAVTENEPSSLVEGVSVITGDFCTHVPTYTAQGAEPIHMQFTYVSSGAFITGYEHSKAELQSPGVIAIREPYGTTIVYGPAGKKDWPGHVGKAFYGDPKNKKKWKTHTFNTDRFIQASLGIANTSSGDISARTHIKNNRVLFDPKIHKKGKNFTFYGSDGTIRHYGHAKVGRTRVVPHSGVFKDKTEITSYVYSLEKEELPNGHVLQYVWTGGLMTEIKSTNKAGNKVFTSVIIPTGNAGYKGSDGQQTNADYQFCHDSRVELLKKLSSPDQPDLFFDWTSKQMLNYEGKPYQEFYLRTLSLPNQRTLHINYDMGGKHVKPKVASLSSPVGKDSAPLVTHRFVYDKYRTDVFDIQNNKARYHWNGEGRLTVIERFIGENTFHSKEHFAWIGTLLVSRSLWDDKGVCKYIRSFEYDPYGNVKQHRFSGNLTGKGGSIYQNPNGSVDHTRTETCITFTDYSGDGKHLPIRVVDPAGLVTHYTYVPGTNLVKTKVLCDRDIPKITYIYDYDEDFLLIQETIDDGISKKIKRIFPKQTQPFLGMPEFIEEKYIEGGQEKLLKAKILSYRAGAKIEKEEVYDAVHKFQYSLSYEYDEKNRIIRQTNALGQEALAKYDASGNRYYYKDFGSSVEEISEYDFSNRLIKKTCRAPEGERIYEYSYDTKHRIEWESDERGHRTYHKYDFLGRCIETKEPAVYTDQGQIVYPTTQRNYDAVGNEILRIDADGFATKTEHNSYGKPLHILHPDGTEEHFSYSLKGDLESHIGPNGIKTVYKYDYLSRITEKALFQNNIEISKETFGYTGYLLTSQIDPEGNVTTYKYDGAGRKISETFGGETIYYSYDSLGRIFTIQEGAEITYKTYDLLDRVIEERKETLSGQVLKKELYAYDEPGNQISITRFIENEPAEERFDYDSFRRLIKKTNPLGNAETISYSNVLDENGQNVSQKVHTDALGLQTIETFDPNGNLQLVEKWKEKTLLLSKKFYTSSGKLSFQIDKIFAPDHSERLVTTRWEYDSMGREITLIEAASTPKEKITRKTYTPTGELKTLTKPDKTQIIYDYNGLKQLITIDASDDSIHHRMSYNRLGHLQTTDGLQRTTDPKGRVLSETFPGGCTIEHHYDGYGRKTSLDISSRGISIVYDYLGNVLQTISRFSGRKQLYSHIYLERDLSRNILKEHLIDASSVKIHRFDPISRKISIQSPYFSQTLERFDPVGNLLLMTRQGESRTYQYDELYQLILETGKFAHNYSYDSLHNRLTKDEEAYTTNALHQDISHFTYNDNGCPIQGQNISFAYDALDRLIEITTPRVCQRYIYDSQHRCLSKTIYRGNDKTTQYFLYDGKKEIGSLDENLSLREFRVLGETPHAELGAAISIELNGKIFIPIHDLQSNLAALIPLDTSPLTRYDYSAFGEETQDGPTSTPWSFSSKRRDPETNLIYYGRRFYIPTLGHWLTPDPSGFTDGMNLYAYVNNEPLMHFDEYGLWLRARPPGSFNSSDVIRNWTHAASAAWNNPRFQGGLQASVGLAEMYAGTRLMGSPFMFLGAATFIHGADQFTAGAGKLLTGRQTLTASEMLLQKTGMSPEWASFSNNLLSMAATGGSVSLANFSAYQASRTMAHEAMSSFGTETNLGSIPSVARNIGGLNGTKTLSSSIELSRFHQAAYNLSEIGQTNISNSR